MNKPKNYPFVEPEIAILADKHHGFAFYEPSDLNHYYNIDLGDGILYKEEECNDYECYAAAPLYQQLIDWFREEHKIHISYYTRRGNLQGGITDFEYYIFNLDYKIENKTTFWSEPMNLNYYDALQEAIKKAFELI